MGTPDKIYLEKFPSGTIGPVWNYDINDCGTNEPIQYIRKDALLELIKHAYGKVSMNPFDFSEAFEELFDKIEIL